MKLWHSNLLRVTALFLLLCAGFALIATAGSSASAAGSSPQTTITPTATGTPNTPTNTRTVTNTRTSTNTRTPTNTGTATPTPGCNDWRQEEVPPGGELVNTFYGIDSTSPDDVWAVGNRGEYSSVDLYTMIQHWDGSAWSLDTYTTTGTLKGVEAIAPDDVWAVGYSYGEPAATLTQHWDGSAWSDVPSPTLEGVNSRLYGVTAAGPDDVWAVGEAGDQALALHWDGVTWSIIETPVLEYSLLNGVAAVASDDVWAVGSFGYYNAYTLALHWDGTAWTQVTTPNDGGWRNSLQGVSASAPNDVWAAGWATSGNSFFSASVFHWDGSQWVSTPVTGAGEGVNTTGSKQLFAIASSGSEVWAVGWGLVSTVRKNVIAKWNGTNWTTTHTPSPSGYLSELFGVTLSGLGEAWAAGIFGGNGSVYEAQMLHYGPPCGTSTPTPTGTIEGTETPTPTSTDTAQPTASGTVLATETSTETATPATPASTETAVEPATETPTQATTETATETATTEPEPSATVGACSLSFTDLAAGDPFYSQVMCLSCMGMVSGYSDGTFRPGNNMTRGQLAKLVSNTAGFDTIPTGQTFEDVPIGSTFYMYVERMFAKGVLGGYACGGVGEPCGEGSRPYFRPSAQTTRGQISKIVANAARYSEPVEGTVYADVDTGNPFYVQITRLTMHGAMAGYACGGVNPQTGQPEPCDGENRPYFRWGNDATRGQASKIVANAFYPDCAMRYHRLLR